MPGFGLNILPDDRVFHRAPIDDRSLLYPNRESISMPGDQAR